MVRSHPLSGPRPITALASPPVTVGVSSPAGLKHLHLRKPKKMEHDSLRIIPCAHPVLPNTLLCPSYVIVA